MPSSLTPHSVDHVAIRSRADQVFSRIAGAPLVSDNHVRVLRDGAENYPAWEQAIRDARSTIHLEMYIIHRDAVGRRFIDALAARARDGVKVRVIYDWFGCGWSPLLGLFRPLVDAGAEVRAFNPPRLSAALGWTTRDHRKYLCIDSRVAYVAGLCIGQMWEGRPDKTPNKLIEPWRDTGVEIIGPATAYCERGFAANWAFAGGVMDPTVPPAESGTAPAGSVNLRLIYTEPFTAAMLRVDLLVAAMARRRLWIADAYFIGHGPYVQALRRAARDGVDVRLLLPQGSDVGWTVPLSRSLYRTLLESGVRIFEWNGSMMHAKTAVADSHWARIGSTNLNLNSWVGNWELDVAIEDAGVAQTMEQHYEHDLTHATEIVMAGGAQRPRRVNGGARAVRGGRTRRSARRALRAVTGVGYTISAAALGNRRLEEWESAPILVMGGILIIIGFVGVLQPRVLAWPVAALGIWMGLSFLAEAFGLLRKKGSS